MLRDFETMTSGLQYKDAKVGSGSEATKGDRVVMDWEGYTIGEWPSKSNRISKKRRGHDTNTLHR